MPNYFIYNGKSSAEMGIYISGSESFGGAEWEIDEQSVPGRNGDFLISQNRMENVDVAYPAFIREKFKDYSEAARLWLLSQCTYKRLEDTYNPDYFRMGYFKGPLNFDAKFLNRSAETKLIFRCKPQRFRKDGEYPREVSNGGQLYNFWMPALPIVKIEGIGTGIITIGTSNIIIENMTGSVTIDSEIQDIYSENLPMNQNSKVTGGFPVLNQGRTGVSWSGGISKVDIIPRWWSV